MSAQHKVDWKTLGPELATLLGAFVNTYDNGHKCTPAAEYVLAQIAERARPLLSKAEAV